MHGWRALGATALLYLSSQLAMAAEPVVTGQIFERVNVSKKTSGGLFVGAVLGELPQRVSLTQMQVASHANTARRRCIEMTSMDGIYEAWGNLNLTSAGLFSLKAPGFSGEAEVVSSYAGLNFTGMLTNRTDCHIDSHAPFTLIEPLYFGGDKRTVQLAINPGQAVAVNVRLTDGQAVQAATCRRTEGRRVAFGMWCTVLLPGRSKEWQIQLTRTFDDGPPRRESPDLQLHLPPP